MRTLTISAAIGIAALLMAPAPASAQFFNGFLEFDPQGVDRPPAPVPNARQGNRRVYKPIEGNFPPCRGFKWVGDRCRLPSGQVCMVYAHGLDSCI